jgi:hypothetical protein
VDGFLVDEAFPVSRGNGCDKVLVTVPIVEDEYRVLGRCNAETWHKKPEIVDSILIHVGNRIPAGETENY